MLRWSVRTALYLVVLVLFAVAALLAWSQTESFNNFVAEQLKAELEKQFATPVSFSSVVTDLINGRLVVHDLVVAAPQPAVEPFLELDSLSVTVDLDRLLAGVVNIPSINLYHPDIHLTITEAGDVLLPRLRQQPQDQEGGGAFTLKLDRINVIGGSFHLDQQELFFDISAGEMLVRVKSHDLDTYSGRARISGISLWLPAVNRLDLELDTEFAYSPELVTVESTLSHEDGEALITGRVRYQQILERLFAEVEGSFDLENLEKHPDYDAEGTLNLEASGYLQNGTPFLNARLTSEYARINEYAASGLALEMDIEDELLTGTLQRGTMLGGELEGELKISSLFSQPYLESMIYSRDLPIRQVFELFNLDYLQAESDLDTDLEIEYDLARQQLVSAVGTIELTTDRSVERAWKADLAKLDRGDQVFSPLGPEEMEVFASAVAPLRGKVTLKNAEDGVRIARGSTLRLTDTAIKLSGLVNNLDTWDLHLETTGGNVREIGLVLTNLERLMGQAWPDYPVLYGTATFVTSLEANGSATVDVQMVKNDLTYRFSFSSPEVHAYNLTATDVTGSVEFADGLVTVQDVTGTVSGGSATVNGTITLNPPDTPPDVPPVSQYTVTIENAGLSALKGLLQSEEPLDLSGSLHATAELRFRQVEEITGEGEIEISNAVINEIQINHATADLKFDQKLEFSNLRITGGKGEVFVANGSLDPLSGDWDVEVTLEPLQMAESSWFNAVDPTIAGTMAVEADLQGNGFVFEGSADINVKDFRFQDVSYGDLSLAYKGEGFSGDITFGWGGRVYELTSDYQQAGTSSTLVVTSVNETIDLTPLAHLLTGDETAFLTLDQGMEIRAYLSEGQLFGAGIDLGSMQVGTGELSLRAREVDVEYNNDMLVFHNIKVEQSVSKGRELTINGSLALDGSQQVRIDISGGVNLLVVSQVLEGFTVSGESILDLRLRGALSKPRIFGNVSIAGGFVRDETTDIAVSNIQGEISFSGNRIELSEISGSVAQGSVLMEGVVELDMQAMQLESYRLTAEALNIRFPLPEGGNVQGGGIIAISGNPAETLVTGEINLDQVLYTARFDPEAEVARLSENQPLPVPDDQLRNIRLDILVRGEDNIIIDNNFAQMTVKSNVRILGNAVDMGATGRVEVIKGNIFYRDRKYEITTGVIEFTEAHRIAPKIDFSAETQVKDYRVFLELHGTPERLYPDLNSDPALSDLDILNLLAVGEVRDNRFVSESERARENLLGLGVSGFLTKQFTGEIERRAENLLGVDRFRIDPIILDLSATPTARLTIGEQINDNLVVIYSTNVSQNEQQVLIVEYQLSPSVQLVATREEDGSYAVDMHLKKLFR